MAEEIEVPDVRLGATADPPRVVLTNLAEAASYTPGSAIIYKGEPSATELGMLRFDLTTEDLKQVNRIVEKIMKRYENLEESGAEAVRNDVAAVVQRIEQDKLAVPFVIDFSAPEDRYSAETKPYSAETKPQDVPMHVSKFVQLLRRLGPRRIGDDQS